MSNLVGIFTAAKVSVDLVEHDGMITALDHGATAVVGGAGEPGCWDDRGDALGIPLRAGGHLVAVSSHDAKEDTYIVHDPMSLNGPFLASRSELEAFMSGCPSAYQGVVLTGTADRQPG